MTPNKKTVDEYMEAFRQSDHARVLACLTDDVEWVMPGFFRLRGKEAFDKEIENPAFTGRPDIVVTRLVEESDLVVAEGTVQARWSHGGRFSAVFCDVFEMRGGKIGRLISYVMEIASGDEASVLATDEAWARAEVAKDEAALRRILDDRFTFNSSAGTTSGKEDLVRAIMTGHMTEQNLTERTVLLDGPVATVFGTAEVKFQPPGGEEMTFRKRYTATYVRRGDQWRALAIHMSNRAAT